jgi:hypothetical protein
MNIEAPTRHRQLIRPDRPQLAFHHACVASAWLYQPVGRRVGSSVRAPYLGVPMRRTFEGNAENYFRYGALMSVDETIKF